MELFEYDWDDDNQHTADVSEMLGKTLVSVNVINGDEQVHFESACGTKWVLYHRQGCCESVTLHDIAGDLNDLVGSPLTMSEESSNEADTEYGSQTWTFYRFATNKGYVNLRWLGESNGYYSESVDCVRIDPADGNKEDAE